MHPCLNEGLAVAGLSRRSRSQGELREWGGRGWQQQWEERPRRPREDELWDDGGHWEEIGPGWSGRGQWEPGRRIEPSRNTGFAHVVQAAVRKERGTVETHKTVYLSGQQDSVDVFDIRYSYKTNQRLVAPLDMIQHLFECA